MALFGVVAISGKRWRTLVEKAVDTNQSGIDGQTLRQLIEAPFAHSGSKIRLTLEAWPTTRSFNVQEVYIGHAATSGEAYAFASTPTEVTFGGGSSGFSLSPGGSIVSDEITFAFDKTKNLVIAIDVADSGTNGVRIITGQAGFTVYAKLANDAQTVAATGYGTSDPGGGNKCLVKKLEVFG